MATQDDDLAMERLHNMDVRYSNGSETDLIYIERDDLGLPASTRDAEIQVVRYVGRIKELERKPQADGRLLVEYDFDLEVTVEAVMSRNDASSLGWEYEEAVESHAVVKACGSLALTARAGVEYGGEDDVQGDIEYVAVRRSDGTPATPIGKLNDDARVYSFSLARRRSSDLR